MQARRLSQALEDMGDLAASDNVDTFVISYNSLLQVSLCNKITSNLEQYRFYLPHLSQPCEAPTQRHRKSLTFMVNSPGKAVVNR